jgi:steroid 5-alpha reductase family enzyme
MSAAEFVVALIAIVAGLSAAMTLAWAVEQRTGNSGWIDTVWTFGLGAVGIASALVPLASDHATSWPRRALVAAAVLAWALRLGFHIASRTAGISDDPRYAALRRGYGANAALQMWLLVQKQALVSIPLALAIFVAAHNPSPALRLQDYVAVLVFLIAIGGEALADRQLRQFRRASSGSKAICDAGLWRWSRHPNYFFEWLGWLGYPLIAIDLSGAYPWGYVALVAPAIMYWLLVYVSGIPPLEEHMLQSRGEAFRNYQACTSAFFPWPPREPARSLATTVQR